jgi:hypothetical protein
VTESNSFSSASGVNPPASGAESTSVNSQDDVSTEPGERVNLTQESVNPVVPQRLFDAALEMQQAGINVVPVKEDGTKAPDLPRWTKYQKQRTTGDQIFSWFGSDQNTGIGCIYGDISGNTEMLEFEGRAVTEGILDEVTDLMENCGFGSVWEAITTGWADRSPSGGMHFRFRVEGTPVKGNTKLASRPSTTDELVTWKAEQQDSINAERNPDVKAKRQEKLDKITRGEQVPQVLVETRGEGGFGVCAPSHGTVHPTGKAWVRVSGGPASIPVIDAETYTAIHDICRASDRMPKEEAPQWRGRPPADLPDGMLRPGDDFNERGDVGDLLQQHGWTFVYQRGTTSYWRRPGKNKGISASFNYRESNRFYVFTSSTEFDNARAYSPFSTYAVLEHSGNYKEAARDLGQQGYGTRLPNHAPVPGQRDPNPYDSWATEKVDAHGQVVTREQVTGTSAAEEAGTTGTFEKKTETVVDPNEKSQGRPVINITNDRDAMFNIIDAIQCGWIPETYVRDGRLVHVGVVSGARNGRRTDPGAAEELQAPDMSASHLRALLTLHTDTMAYNKNGAAYKMVSESLCKAVLSLSKWNRVPHLTEITPMPFVREDGTICQAKGYDRDTGVWLNVDDGFPVVADRPSDDEAKEALRFLVSELLADFAFVDTSDRANFLALLLTPALSRVIGGLNPFGVISAANQGSGKSLLAKILSSTYGGNGETTTLPRQDEEIRKKITSILMSDPNKIITFDNIGAYHPVDSPVLAQLLTSVTWSDRALGGNDVVSRLNDRLWVATGNNVRLGGDMGSRSVFVRIDPKVEDPGSRDTQAFALGDLEEWLKSRNNRVRVMHALLVLIRHWAAAGMPKARQHHMRSFTGWAQTLGGLLEHHGITGFRENTSATIEADDEKLDWAQFLATWHQRHGGDWVTASQLLDHYKTAKFDAYGTGDPWQGTFPVDNKGNVPTARSLGMRLKYIRDRPFYGWVLRARKDDALGMQTWRPEKIADKALDTGPDQLALTLHRH